MGETEKTYDTIAEAYTKNYSKLHVTDAFRRKFATLAGKGRILDLGCGPGLDAKFFSEKFSVVGIDSSPEMIKIARRENEGNTAVFILQDMRRVGFPRRHFDGVWASQSVNHIPKRQCRALLKKLRQRMRPGGILFACVMKGSADGFTDKAKNKIFLGKRRYLAKYEKPELREMITSGGYNVLEIREKRRSDGEVYFCAFAKGR